MLPDISVVWVILAVLLLAVALDRVLFKPLLRVMRARETAVTSAMELAQTASARAQEATAQFDAKVGAARADIYKQMDERRKAAEHYRADVMTQTRQEVDSSLATAKAQLDAQTAAAKTQLEQDADAMGREIARKILGTTSVLLIAAWTLFLSPPIARAAQPAHTPADQVTPAATSAEPSARPEHATQSADAPPATTGEHGAAAQHEAATTHENPIVGMIAKLLNFSILVGTLVYFLKSPFNEYLTNRKTKIRSDLVKAAEMKTSAAAQLAAVADKLAALPAELDGLRRTGATEVAAEEARIRDLADKERQRLLTQMEREIGLHGKAAERDLIRLAADRAITAATSVIEKTITPADHVRLQERYVAMVNRR